MKFIPIAVCIQRYIREVHPSEDTNLFQQPVFSLLKNVCDVVFK